MKKTLTKYYFRIKYEDKPAEFACINSSGTKEDLVNYLFERCNTPSEWARGFVLESICETDEYSYQQWSLTLQLSERINRVEFDGRNKFLKHETPSKQIEIARKLFNHKLTFEN